MLNQGLVKELHKPIIMKLKRRKIYSSFKDILWGADLADIQLINKYDKGIPFLLCFFDISNKYALFIPFKVKKGIKIVMSLKNFKINSRLKIFPYLIIASLRVKYSIQG